MRTHAIPPWQTIILVSHVVFRAKDKDLSMEQVNPGSVPRFQLSRHSTSLPQEELRRPDHSQSTLALVDPTNLVLRAYDAMHMGILVVSKEGIIRHYNSTYAQLRRIPSERLIGRSVTELDRRQSIRAFLETGMPQSERAIDSEMRRNQETYVPIQEDGHLLGC